MLHRLLIDPPWALDWGGVRWGLVHNDKREHRDCEMCGKAIRVTARSYRTRGTFAGRSPAYMHQKCLLGQIDSTVWDIAIGGSGG